MPRSTHARQQKSNQSRDPIPLSLNVKKERDQRFRYFPAYAAATAGVLMSLSSVIINLKQRRKKYCKV
jgi:hypothetical protein